MSDYVYVAIVQEPMASLDGGGTMVAAFLSSVSAQKWVDNILADCYDGDEEGRINWDIQPLVVQ